MLLDHAHMVLSIPPKLSVAMAVGYLKGIGDTDPPRGGEREARLYGQAFLVERVLHKHSGLDEQVIRAYRAVH